MSADRGESPGLAADLAALGTRLQTTLQQAAALQPVPARTTPRELIYREDSLRLYRYGEAADGPPVVIVYSLVNRPDILDLRPERSLIRTLSEAGLCVYLIDWGDPEPVDRFLDLDDYINGYLRRCVDRICRDHGVAAIDLLGVCQGGTFGICFAALHPQRVNSLVTLVAPVDFHAGGGTLHHLASHVDADALVDAFGNISAELLNAVFVSLKPYRLLSQRYVEMAALADDPEGLANFLRMERWMYDSPNQAGEAYRQFAKDFYQLNKLIRGELLLGGRPVRLDQLKMPIYNVYASDDHLVPAASAQALRAGVGSDDYTELEFTGGHLSVFISGRARHGLFPAIADWLLERQGKT